MRPSVPCKQVTLSTHWWGPADGTLAGIVSLLKSSAVTPDGLNEKYKTLQISDLVRSLVMLEEGGLAAGTLAGTVDLFISQP